MSNHRLPDMKPRYSISSSASDNIRLYSTSSLNYNVNLYKKRSHKAFECRSVQTRSEIYSCSNLPNYPFTSVKYKFLVLYQQQSNPISARPLRLIADLGTKCCPRGKQFVNTTSLSAVKPFDTQGLGLMAVYQ